MSGFIRPWDINQQAEQEEKNTQPKRSLYDNFSDLFSAASANFDEVRGAERLGDLRSELMNSQGLSDDEYNAKRAQYVQEYLNREDARKRYLQAHQNLVDDDSFLQNLDQFGGTAEGMIAQAAGTVGGAAIGALASPFTAGGSIALGAKFGNAAGAVVGAGYDANSVALQAEEEVLDAGGTWEQAQQAKSEAFKKAALTTLPETLVDIALGNRLVRAGLNSNLARKVANSVLGRAGSAVLDPAAKLGTKAAFASGKSLVGRGVGLATDIALQGATEAGQEVTQDYIANREVAKALGQKDNEYSLGGFVDYARSPQGLETMKTAGIMGSVFGGAGGVLSSGQYLQRGAQTNTGIKVHNTTDKLIGNGTLKLDKQARAEEEQRLSVLTGISRAELSTWSDADIIAQASVTDGEVRNLIHRGDEDSAVSTVRESADIISRLEQTDNKNAFRYGEIRKDSALNQYLEELGIDESDRKNWFSSLGEESLVEKVTQTENKQNNQTEQNGQKKTILKGSPEFIQSVKESENQAASEIYDTVGSEYEPTVIDMSSPSNMQEQIKSDGTKVEKIEPQIGNFVLQPSDRYEDSYDYRNTKTNRLFRVEKNNGGWSVKDITDGENDTETVGHTFNQYKDARNYLMSNNSTETKVYQKADNAGLKEKLGEGDVNAEEGTSGQLANSVDDLYNYMTQNPGVLDPFVFSEFVKLKQRLGTDNIEFHLDMSRRGYVKDAATGQYGRVMGWADKNESTGRAIIQLYHGADLGTAIHEIAHIGYWNLSEQDRKTFDNYAVKSSGRFIADILGEEYNDDFIQRLKNIREDEDLQNRINEKDVTAQVKFLLNSLNKQSLGIGVNEQASPELMKEFLKQRQQAIEERWAWEFSAWYVEGYSKGVEPSNIKDRILDRACRSMESELNALQKIWEHLHGQDSNIEQIYRNINTNGQNANWTQNEVEQQVEQQQIQESGQIEQQPVQATPQEQVVGTTINNGQQTISNPYVNENPYVNNNNTGTSTIYDTSNQGQNFNNEEINEQQNTEQPNRNVERASANREEESQLNLIMNDETAEIFADEALKRYDNDIEQIKSILRQKYKKAKSKKEKNWITKIVRIAEQKYRKMKNGVATNQNEQNTNNNQNYNQEYGINGNQPVGLYSQNIGELSSRNNGYFNPNPLQLNPAIQQEEQTSIKQEPQKENVEKPVKQVEQQVEQTEEEYEEDYEDIDDRIDEIFDSVQSLYKYDLDEDSQEYIKEDTDEIVEIAQNGNYNTVKKLIEHCTKKVNGAAQSLRSKKGKEAANKETAIYNTCYYSALKEKLNDVLSGKEKTKEQANTGLIDKVKETIAEQLGETFTEENASAESMSTGFNEEQDEIGERIRQADRDAVSAYKQINTNLRGKTFTSENEVDMSNLTKEQRDQLKKIRDEYEAMSSADDKRSKYKTKQEKAQEFVSMEERDEQQKKIEQNKEEIKEFGEEQEKGNKSSKVEQAQQILNKAFPNKRLQYAWHSTPHDFNKFTLEHLLSGEGAMAHGWGLYFSREMQDNKGQYYDTFYEAWKGKKKTENHIKDEKIEQKLRKLFRDALGFSNIFDRFVDNEIDKDVLIKEIEEELQYKKEQFTSNKKMISDIEKSINNSPSSLEFWRNVIPNVDKMLEDKQNGFVGAKKQINALSNIIKILKGDQVYTEKKDVNASFILVNIPENEYLLKEVGRFDKQSKFVQRQLLKLMKDQKFTKPKIRKVMNSYKIYNELCNIISGGMYFRNGKEVSILLNKYGIKGMQYDGATDVNCVVVFDDKCIDIISKFQKVEGEIKKTQSYKDNKEKQQPTERDLRKLKERQERDAKRGQQMLESAFPNRRFQFADTEAWQGTIKDFDKFTLSYIGKVTGSPWHGWGLYFTRQLERARYYTHISHHNTIERDMQRRESEGEFKDRNPKSSYHINVGGEAIRFDNTAREDFDEMDYYRLGNKNEMNVITQNALESFLGNIDAELDETDYEIWNLNKENQRKIIEKALRKTINELEKNDKDIMYDKRKYWEEMGDSTKGYYLDKNETLSLMYDILNKFKNDKNYISVTNYDNPRKTDYSLNKYIYKVSIPSEKYMIDYRIPYSKQSDYIKKRLIKSVSELKKISLKEAEEFLNGIEYLTGRNGRKIHIEDGEAIYGAIREEIKNQLKEKENIKNSGENLADKRFRESNQSAKIFETADRMTSELLLKNGIEGVSYFTYEDGDAYVIFNADAVKILSKLIKRPLHDRFEKTEVKSDNSLTEKQQKRAERKLQEKNNAMSKRRYMIGAIKRQMLQQNSNVNVLQKLQTIFRDVLKEEGVSLDYARGIFKKRNYVLDANNEQDYKLLKAHYKANEEIWEQFKYSGGFFLGLDGKWKFWFSDKNAKLKIPFDMLKEYFELSNKLNKTHQFTLDKVLQHDLLFKYYPELKNVKVTFESEENLGGAHGSYNPKTNEILVNRDHLLKKEDWFSGAEINEDTFKETLFHEIQHAIQHIEGFASGGSSYDIFSYKDELLRLGNIIKEKIKEDDSPIAKEIYNYSDVQMIKLLRKFRKENPLISRKSNDKSLEYIRKTFNLEYEPFLYYISLLGEIESRFTGGQVYSKDGILKEAPINDEILNSIGEKEIVPGIMSQKSQIVVRKRRKRRYMAGAKGAKNSLVKNTKVLDEAFTKLLEKDGISKQVLNKYTNLSDAVLSLKDEEGRKFLKAFIKANRELFKKEGVYRGFDGEWRFWISDKNAKFSYDIRDIFKEAKNLIYSGVNGIDSYETTLGGILTHTKLFKYYPELKDIKVKFFHGQGIAGYYSPQTDIEEEEIGINVNAELFYKDPYFKKKIDEYSTMGCFLHEIQHAIQSREGLARGSSADLESLLLSDSNLNSIIRFIKDNKDKLLNSLVERGKNTYGKDTILFNGVPMFFRYKQSPINNNVVAQINGVDFIEEESFVLNNLAIRLNDGYDNRFDKTKEYSKDDIKRNTIWEIEDIIGSINNEIEERQEMVNDYKDAADDYYNEENKQSKKEQYKEDQEIIKSLIEDINTFQKQLDFAERLKKSIENDNVKFSIIDVDERKELYSGMKDTEAHSILKNENEIKRMLEKVKKDRNSLTKEEKRKYRKLKKMVDDSGIMGDYYNASSGEKESKYTENQFVNNKGEIKEEETPLDDLNEVLENGGSLVIDKKNKSSNKRFMKVGYKSKNQTILTEEKEKKAEQFFRKWANKNGYDNEFIDKYFNQKDLGDEVILDRKDKKINSFIEYIDKFNKGMIQKYGIQRELDGRWSYELDDSNSKVNDYFTKKETLEKIRQKGVTGNIKLEKVLKHDELYKLYPHLKDINVVFLTDTNMKNAFPNLKTAIAAFDKVNNKIYMNVDKLGKTQNDIRENIHNNLLHEIQHSIQHFEGFAEGFGDTTEKKLIRENKMLDDYFKKTGIRNYGELSYKLLDLLKNYGQALRALAKQDPNTYSEYLKDLNRVTPNMYNLIKNHPDQVIRGFIHNDTKLKNAYDWMNGVKYIDKSKNTYNALIKPLEEIRNLYSTTLGEINARKSAGRRSLTAEQRKTVNTENLNEARMNMPRNKKSPILIKGARRYQLTKEQLEEFDEMDKREEKEYNKRQERIEKADNAGELSDQVKDVYSVTFTKSAQNFAENRTRMEYFDNRQKYWDRSEKDGKVTYTRKTPFSHHQKVITYNGSNEFLKEQRKKSKPEQWLEWVKDQIIKYAFNDMHFLAKAARKFGKYDAYVKMIVTKGYALKANTAMQRGIKYNGKYTRALNDIIKEIGEEKQNQFIEYCIAKRVVDLSNRDVPVYQDMKPDEAKELIKQYESGKDAQLFMKNQKDFVEYNIALLHILVDSGIHTEEEFQNLVKNDPNFVPLTKVMDDADMGFNSIQAARSIVNVKTPLKRIGTSFRKIKNPFLEMQKRTAEYYAIASRNKAGQIFVNEIAKALDKNAKGDVIQKGQGMIRKVKVDEKDGSIIIKPDDKQQIIYVCNNGEHEFYQVSDPEIYRALKALDADQMGTIQKMIDPFLHAPSAFIRETATMVPDFGVRNLLRDGGEAFITSEHGFLPFIDQIWGMYQMANNTEWYQRFLEQKGEYGTYNRDSANDGVARIEDTIDEKINPIKNFNEIRRAALEKLTNKKNSKMTRATALLQLMGSMPYAIIKSNKRLNDYLEMGTRIGEFKNAKMGYEGTLDRLSKGGILDWSPDINKAKLDDVLAAGAAKEITLNFEQYGIIGKQLNRYIPFFNATLQGIYKMCNALELMATGTTLSGEKNHKLQSELLFKAALVTAIGVGVAAAGEGDDDYEEANQYEKENFWILPNGLRFPKDQVLGKLFGNVAEKSYTQWRKGKFEPSDILKSIKENFTPDKFIPALAEIALGGMYNYDTFYKSAIVPEYMQGKLGHLQKDLSTSNMASDVSDFLWKYTKTDVSAKRLDWALQKNLTNCKKYIDAVYDLGKKAYDPKSFNEKMARGYDKNDSTGAFVGGLKDDVPKPLSLITGTFATNRTNYKSISDFYEKYNEYKKLATDEASMSKEEKRQWKRYEQAYKKDMVYRKQLRAIKGDSSLTGKQKREKADKIFKQQIKLAKWAEG